jgi:cellulose synthase/poly-beta-1,6-N-acetylglucosamine synthase-like glycosyltransferase
MDRGFDVTLFAAVVFWLSVTVVAFVYFGYPATLLLARRRPPRANPGAVPPKVSVLIAAYNEARVIGATVANKLDSDYPPDRLELVVVSDGSEDGTDEIVRGFADRGVKLVRQSPRQGKTMALNLAREIAGGEIIVFSDANSLYDRSTIRRLVAAFEDPEVGYATGQLLYWNPAQSGAAASCGLFMRYENWLRRLETRVGSIVGVNGGVDAVRRALYAPMRADQLPDFVLPLSVVEQGRRVVFAPEALSFEDASATTSDEFQMRVRVSLRAYRALADMRRLLHPGRGLFAYQLLVHKVLRYALFAPLALAFVSNLLLLQHPLHQATMAAQAAFYAAALAGFPLARRTESSALLAPYYLVLTNAAAAVAFVRFLRRDRAVTWKPRKGA